MAKITETELLKRGFVYNDLLDSYDLLYMDMNNGVGDRITVKRGRLRNGKRRFIGGTYKHIMKR